MAAPRGPQLAFPLLEGAPSILLMEELMHLYNLAILGLLFLIAAGQCTAQVQGESYHGHGYAYVAPGGLTAGGNTLKAIALGAGGEAMLYKGLAAGADIGWQGPPESFRN